MKKQIVYLQPNDEIAAQFTEHLASDDIEILRAKSGEEALEIISSEEVLLLLIDINIPDMRLREVVERVRRISPQIILNVCIDVLDPLLITKLSNRHDIHKIYVAPWNTEDIVEEMKESLEVALINEQFNIREQHVNSEIEELNSTLESLKETLKKQQRSYAKFSNVTKCFTDVLAKINENDSGTERKIRFAKDIFDEYLKMQTTGSFDIDRFEDDIRESLESLKGKAPGIRIGEIISCLIGGQSRTYAQNIRFGIYLIARYCAEFYRDFSISVTSHHITTRLAEVCISISDVGNTAEDSETMKDYLGYVRDILSGITKDYRKEQKGETEDYYFSFPVSRE